MKKFFIPYFAFFSLAVLSSLVSPSTAKADILAAGFFSGTIDRYTEATGTFSTFTTITTLPDFAGLSGIAVNQAANRVYATGYQTGRLYEIDATTGQLLNSVEIAAGAAPGGVAVNAAGNIYVTNQGGQGGMDTRPFGNEIFVFNSSLGSLGQIVLPDIGLGANRPGGIGFTSDNRIVVSTLAGGGLLQTAPNGLVFSSPVVQTSSTANSQIAIDSTNGTIAVGGVFTNDVSRYNSALTSDLGPVVISASVLPPPGAPFASFDINSPSGVAFTPNGNLIVGALGRTNPLSSDDNFQSNGGLFLFSPTGTLLQTYGVNINPYSSVAFISAVPEPTTIAMLAALTACVGVRQWRLRHVQRAV